jgi:hypothetical protein
LQKRNDAGASSGRAYFEDCRKRPEQRSDRQSLVENLQRKGGFKGFNQHAVSMIIAETDPRKQGG